MRAYSQETRFLVSPQQQLFWNLVRGVSRGMQPPVTDMDALWTIQEKYAANSMMNASLIGEKASIKAQLIEFQAKYHADELIAINYIFDEEKQLRSYSLLKEVVGSL